MFDNTFFKIIWGFLISIGAILTFGGFLWLITELPKRIKAKKEKQNRIAYDTVTSYSTKYRQLVDLISTSPVVSIPNPFYVEYTYKSKQSMERANANEVIIYLSNENPELKKLYAALTNNRKYRKEFMNAVSLINETQDVMVKYSGIPKDRFYQIENDLFYVLVNSVREDTIIEIKLSYSTPKGKYEYSRTLRTDYQGLSEAYKEIGKRNAAKIARELERSKLNASLRYDVLRRDGFKCTICGATQAEGAKLHVDHIIPVSKGGKTELRNLRTLCDLCNLGKSNKYDASGIN